MFVVPGINPDCGSTVSCAVPRTPSTVAVMVVFPISLPVATAWPACSAAATVAVTVSSEAHTIVRPVRSEMGAPDASKAVTVRVTLPVS